MLYKNKKIYKSLKPYSINVPRIKTDALSQASDRSNHERSKVYGELQTIIKRWIPNLFSWIKFYCT